MNIRVLPNEFMRSAFCGSLPDTAEVAGFMLEGNDSVMLVSLTYIRGEHMVLSAYEKPATEDIMRVMFTADAEIVELFVVLILFVFLSASNSAQARLLLTDFIITEDGVHGLIMDDTSAATVRQLSELGIKLTSETLRNAGCDPEHALDVILDVITPVLTAYATYGVEV